MGISNFQIIIAMSFISLLLVAAVATIMVTVLRSAQRDHSTAEASRGKTGNTILK